MGPLHVVVRMEKLAPVGNYPNNRMRRLGTSDLSHQQCSGEVCCGSEEKSQRSHIVLCFIRLHSTLENVYGDPCMHCLEKLLKTLFIDEAL